MRTQTRAMRTVAAKATIRPSAPIRLKNNAADGADGTDANFPPQSGPEKTGGSGLEYAAMSAVEALKAARAAGIELALDGDDLALSAASAPPAAVLDALSRHKAEIVALLRPGRDGWSARGLAGLL